MATAAQMAAATAAARRYLQQGVRTNPRLAARPRGQPWGAPQPDPYPNAPDPRLPQPQGTPALRDVPRLGARNFVSDADQLIGDTVKGLTHADLQAGRTIADPNTPWWYKMAAPMLQTLRPGAGMAVSTPGQRQAQTAATGIINDFVSQPGEPLGSQAKRTIAYHPAHAAADAAMMFAPEEGYAAALADAAKVPGAGGVALRTALRAGNTARKVINPLEGVPAAFGQTTRAAQNAIRSGGLVDGKTGLLTPQGLAQVRKLGATATPGLQDTDYLDPRVQRQVAQTIQQKGLTPASLREAVLQYHGAPTPRGPITGIEPPAGTGASDTADLIKRGHKTLDAKVAGIVTPPKAMGTPTADQIRTFANDPAAVAKAGITPADTTDLRMAAEGKDALGRTMGPATSADPVDRLVRGLVKPAGAAAAGYVASQFLPADLLNSIPGGQAAISGGAAAAEKGYEWWRAAQRAKEIGEGAPATAGALNPVAGMAEAGAATAGALPVAHAAFAPPPAPPPPPQLSEPDTPIEFGDNPKLEAPPPDAPPGPALKKGEVDPYPNAPDPRKTEQGAEPPKPGAADDTDAPIDFGTNPKLEVAPAPQADGGRVGFAVGGQVGDMTERLLRRAEQAQKAARSATRPLLGLSDDTVAQALRVAQRGL